MTASRMMVLKAPTSPWEKFMITRSEASRLEKMSALAGRAEAGEPRQPSGKTWSSAAP